MQRHSYHRSPLWRSFCAYKRNQNTVKGDRFPLDKPLSIACSAGYEFRFFSVEKSKSVLRTDTLSRCLRRIFMWGSAETELNAPAAHYKRRRVERNLHLSRADPSLCFGQPSPLRCVLLSPAGLASRRGPQFSGKAQPFRAGCTDAWGSRGPPRVTFGYFSSQKSNPTPGRRTNEYLL